MSDEKEVVKLQMRAFVVHAKRAFGADSVLLLTADHKAINRDEEEISVVAALDAGNAKAAAIFLMGVAEWCGAELEHITKGDVSVRLVGADGGKLEMIAEMFDA